MKDGTICICRDDRTTCYTIYMDEALLLWCEVLQLAIDDLNSNKTKKHAAEWFISNAGHVGSFLWICSTLGIEAELLRRKLGSKIYYQFIRRGKDLSHLVSEY